MENLRIVLLFLLISISYSCDNEPDNGNDSSCFQIDNNDRNKYTIDRKWEFLGFFYQDTHLEDCKPVTLDEMSIVFSDTNRFHAVSSCNTFEGYYSVVAPDEIKIDSVSTTLILCIDDTIRQWEKRYLDELKNARNFRINRNILVIETTSKNSIVFKAD